MPPRQPRARRPDGSIAEAFRHGRYNLRVAKYASRELRDYFDAHGRPTRVSWFGSAAKRRAHLAGQRAGASGAA